MNERTVILKTAAVGKTEMLFQLPCSAVETWKSESQPAPRPHTRPIHTGPHRPDPRVVTR